MRLVCPNCVAQYEVADGTIPDSGRDVQCANCGHIWFQDAAFKLSTDDLTYVPQRRTAPRHDDDDDTDGDAPGMFHSMRAAGASKDEVTSRTLPEVGNNVLDILRSEAAFSSRRRAEALAETDRAAPQDTPDSEASEPSVGTRTGDRAPEAAPSGATVTQDTGRAEDAFRALAWRNMGGTQNTDPAEQDAAGDLASDPADADDTGHTPPVGDWRRQASADRAEDEDGYGGPYDDEDRYDEQDFDEQDHDFAAADDDTDQDETDIPQDHAEPDRDVTGLAADDAKRIAEAAVTRSYGSGLTAQPAQTNAEELPPAEDTGPDATAIPPEGLRRVARRIPVRSLTDTAATRSEPDPSDAAEPDADTDQAETTGDEVAAFEEAARFDARALTPEDPADSQAGRHAGASFAATYLEPETADSDDSDEDEFKASDAHDEGEDTDESLDEDAPDAAASDIAAPPPAQLDDPNDIRQVRRSLVENRKVLLPDVEELNTSLRMDRPATAADLRASAFSDEAAANRGRFWLGLVTALMLFGILSALYLMGPAIADTFPAADPYVAAYRDFVDTSLYATAGALEPVVAWLESL